MFQIYEKGFHAIRFNVRGAQFEHRPGSDAINPDRSPSADWLSKAVFGRKGPLGPKKIKARTDTHDLGSQAPATIDGVSRSTFGGSCRPLFRAIRLYPFAEKLAKAGEP
jgi:hypothetical protein